MGVPSQSRGSYSPLEAASGGNPTLEITSIDGNDLTVMGTQWQPGDTITLGYATTTQTTALTPLPVPMNSFSIEADSFTVNLTWPSSVAANTYYLGAEGQVTGGPFFYAQPLQVDTMGKVVSGVIATATLPPGATGTASEFPTSTPHATATHKVAGGGSTPTPGNQGTQVTSVFCVSTPGDQALLSRERLLTTLPSVGIVVLSKQIGKIFQEE